MMKLLTIASITLSAVAMVAMTGAAQEKPREQPQPTAQGQASASVPVYRPPLRGAPRGRIGGGTRGVGTDTIVLSVLAPDHAGLTASEQPSLYWSISTRTAYPVELTVTDPRTTEPVLEARLSGPVEAGLHRVRLADHGVRLEPDVPYRWYIAIVVDPERRAKDVLAGGIVERVALPDKLRQRLAQARKDEAPSIYAEDGFWYDALSAASDLVEAAPGDPAPRRERAALLSQVGLRDVRE